MSLFQINHVTWVRITVFVKWFETTLLVCIEIFTWLGIFRIPFQVAYKYSMLVTMKTNWSFTLWMSIPDNSSIVNVVDESWRCLNQFNGWIHFIELFSSCRCLSSPLLWTTCYWTCLDLSLSLHYGWIIHSIYQK